MVRGLALRSLSSLRMESVLEYIELPLKKALTDISAYVRKTAVMGVLKVCSLFLFAVSLLTYCNSLYGSD
jgi:AP-4 complex subunit beta-1